MWHKPCRTFHLWCLCIKTRCLSFLLSGWQPGMLDVQRRFNDCGVDRSRGVAHLWPPALGLARFMENSWWRHQMETFSALLALCAGNSPVPGEFPAQRPVTRSFDVFFDLRLNKPLSKQWWGWWFETLSSPSWRQCNVLEIVKFSASFMVILNVHEWLGEGLKYLQIRDVFWESARRKLCSWI